MKGKHGAEMKKKFITERKWDREFDRLSEGLGEKSNEDEGMVFSPESFGAYMERVINMPDYQIIGVRYQIKTLIRRVKERHHNQR